MSRAIVVGVLVIALVSLFAPGVTQKARAAPPGCDNHDLRGSYGVVGSGVSEVTYAPYTYASSAGYSGVINFDGLGAFSATIPYIQNFGVSDFSGTYSVSPDCSGVINAPEFPAGLVVVQGGSEILFNTNFLPVLYFVDRGVPTTGVMKKIKAPPSGCDNRDLQGSYGIAGSGVSTYIPSPTPFTSSVGYSGVVNFDGLGAVSGLVPWLSVENLSGTYSALPDCRGTINAFQFTAYFVVVQGGSEILFNTDPISMFLFAERPVPTTGVMKKLK